jgi:hypothetical protein
LEDLTKSVSGTALVKGPFDLTFNVQGEGLSPPGVVAGLSGEGTLSLGAGILQSLSSAPLRGVATLAGNKTIKVDKDAIEAEARGVREKITKGIYRYAPAKLAFEVKNGTLRLAPTALLSTGAETKLNGYVELASLKLDSEWTMNLTGPGSKDVPPVTLLFTGALNKAGEIAPAIDTAAIEAYLTMRRMQEDVQRLETLDVSGKTPEPADAAPDETTSAVPAEPAEPADAAPMPEPEPLEQSRPTAATEQPNQAIPQSSPSAKASPSAIDLLQEAWQTEPVIPAPPKPVEAMPAPPAEIVAPKPPAASAAAVDAPTPPPAAPLAEPSPPASPPPPVEAAAPQPEQPTPATVEVVKPRPRPVKPKRKPEAPDDWKKGISIFGGG